MSLLSLIRKILRRDEIVRQGVGRSGRHPKQKIRLSDSPVAPATAPPDSRRKAQGQARHQRHAPIKRNKRSGRKRSNTWVPVGETVVVKGRRLSGGMLYVGSSLRGVSQYVNVDPALIDPGLSVNNREGLDMSYWPSYSEITPASRAAYLDWLAADRPSGADIGYVFLFFYGIERRILFEIDQVDLADAETSALIAEVERLLNLYREDNSFARYASEFLQFVNCLQAGSDVSDLEPPLDGQGRELPLELKLGLGSMLANGEPLPASWALSWFRLHPEVSLRTAAVRCAAEFNTLFKLRYHQVNGPGMKIPRNKTPLTISYRPASSSFSRPVKLGVDNLPDVSRLKKPIRRLQKLAEAVTDELAPYSRWVGRSGDRESLGAIALLPPELISASPSMELRDFLEKIESALDGKEIATIPVLELVDRFPTQRTNVLSAREAATFARLLERLGFGIAPDVRYSKINLTKHEYAAVFRLPDQQAEPSDRYRAATVLLHLGAAVSTADGTVTADEERILETHLEQALELPKTDRIRLRALLHWLLIEAPTLSRMKSRMETLTVSDRKLVARFAVTVAGADGSVNSDEIKVLNRVYKLVGLDTEQLHRDMHEMASGPATRPVTVSRPDATIGYRVPPQPDTHILNTDRVELNRERIAEVMKATRQVSDLLTDIFEGSDNTEPSDVEIVDAEPDAAAPAAHIAGGHLDPAHVQLVEFLAQRSYWPRSEFEESAVELGLMPAGAIETINDVAFELCDEPMVEGDDPLEVNEFAIKELLDAT